MSHQLYYLGFMIDTIPNEFENTFILTALNDSQNKYPIELSSFVDVKLVIIDIDDNEPEFGELTFVRNVSDNLVVGSTVTFIPLAHDRDTDEKNTQIRYFIISGNDENKFQLDQKTGELKLVDELERSVVKQYTLAIKATSSNQLIENNSPSVLTVVLNVVI